MKETGCGALAAVTCPSLARPAEGGAQSAASPKAARAARARRSSTMLPPRVAEHPVGLLTEVTAQDEINLAAAS